MGPMAVVGRVRIQIQVCLSPKPMTETLCC